MSNLKKVIFTFLIGIYLLFAGASPSLAQQSSDIGPWYSESMGQWFEKVYTGDQTQIFGERYTAAQVRWVFYGILAFLMSPGGGPSLGSCIATKGGDVSECAGALKSAIDSINSFQQQQNRQQTGNFIQNLFADRELSGITYVKDIARKFNLVHEAKAQGFGFTLIGQTPIIQSAWKEMRNVSYAIFVFIAIAFAFMIMFRVKISPQLVITVQSALPKLAVTLVLVTFSYAIAGFLVDLMYVVIGAVSLIFSRFWTINLPLAGFNIAGNPGAAFTLLTQGPAGLGILGFLVAYFIAFLVGWIIIFFFGLAIGGSGALVSILTLFVGILALIFIIILIVINFFRIVWMLAKTFILFLIMVIFAPLMLTFGAIIPGMSFGSWLKGLISKLAVFVVAGVLFLLSFWFLQVATSSITSIPGLPADIKAVLDTSLAKYSVGVAKFTPGWPPLLGGSVQTTALLFMLGSLAVFMMIHKAGDMAESFISGKQFNFGSAIGESVGLLGTAGSMALGSAMGRENTRLENEIRREQAAGHWPNAEKLAQELRRRQQVQSLANEGLKKMK